MNAAGDALDKITEASTRVSATIAEIAQAAVEQANGIDEMSHAVAHMDEMTQQNAALAEQSAASATALNGQIQRLNGLVATFKIDAKLDATVAQDLLTRASRSLPAQLQKLATSAFGRRDSAALPLQNNRARVAHGGGWSEF